MGLNGGKIAAVLFISLIVIVAGMALGSVNIPMIDVVAIIGNRIMSINMPPHIEPSAEAIVWSVRMPRVALAFLAGAALSISGVIMQSVLRNPLASSYTLGVSSGASLGAGLVIFLGFALPFAPGLTIPIVGFVFGLATILAVVSMAENLDRRNNNITIILVGMILSLFINAITTLLFALFGENAERMVFWQMGSFAMQGWDTVLILAPVCILGLLLVRRGAMELDMLTFGEEQAEAMGVSVQRVKKVMFIGAAALTGATISFVGIVGFVDLVSPHIVRRIFGASHALVLPMSALVGGSFMVACDLVARTILSPIELPVGAVTAMLGAPFFAYIYYTNGRQGRKMST